MARSSPIIYNVLRCVKPFKRHASTVPKTGLSSLFTKSSVPSETPLLHDVPTSHICRLSADDRVARFNNINRRMLSRRAAMQIHHRIPEKDPIETLLDSPLTAELTEHDYFNVRNLVTVRDLFDARVHLGHTVGTLDTKMAHHLYGKRFDICMFDLEQTHKLLGDALNVLAHIVYRGGMVLFISRNRYHAHTIETMAREAGEYSHCRYWQGGTLSNAEMVFGSLTRLPDAVVFFTTLNSVLSSHRAVVEAASMNIPTIAVLDSNSNPDMITYPIPGNDDSLASIELYCRVFRETILRAKNMRQKVFKTSADETKASDAVTAIVSGAARESGSDSTNRYPVEPSGRAGEVFERHEQPPTDSYLDNAGEVDDGASQTIQPKR